MAVRRDGNQSGSRKRKKPASSGHPSRGGTTVGGGTKGRKPTVYKSPTPSVPQQRREANGAPVSDIRGRGDKAPRGSGHTTRAERIRKNRAERRSALRQLRALEAARLRSISDPRDVGDAPGYGGIPSPAAVRSQIREERKIVKDIGRLRSGAPRHLRTTSAERLADAKVVSSLSEKRAKKNLSGSKDVRKDVIKDYKSGKIKTKAEKERAVAKLKTAGVSGTDILDSIGAKGVAAGIDILEETTRPLHAISAAERSFLKKGVTPDIAKAAVRGLKNEDKSTFSDVLGDLGVPKGPVRTIGGFAGDVAGDPLTWLSAGTVGVARSAATKAGQKAAKKAAKAGMSKAGQENVRRAAYKRALANAPKNKGLTVGTKKRRTSGRATAALSRNLGVTRLGARARNKPITQDVGSHLRPDFRKKGVPGRQHEEVQAAAAERRSALNIGGRRMEALAARYKKEFSTSEYEEILDAVEAGAVGKLRGTKLHSPAVRLRSELRHMNRLERRAGVRASSRKNYVPHVRRQDVEMGPPRAGRGGKSLGAAKKRKIESSLAELREESPDLFTEDIPSILAKRGGQSVRSVAHADFERAVASQGRRLTPKSYASIGNDEAIYHIAPSGSSGGPRLRKVYPSERGGKALKEVQQAIEGRGQSGQYLIINERLADDALDAANIPPVGSLRRRYRKAHGTFKTLLTMPMPSYHMRNLYGDTANAWYAQSAPELARNLGTSMRSMRTLRSMRKSEGKLTLSGRSARRGGTIKVGDRKYDTRELLQEAEKHGGLNAGFSRDLLELLGENPGKITGKLRNVGELRENLVRFASYTGARRQGLSPREAAKRTRELHFDYGDLTPTERAIRDLIPFYTFAARNTVLQAKKLVTRPGKLATYQKAIEEGAKAAGLPPDWQDNLKDYQKLGIPLPAFGLESMGKKLMLLPGFPIMDLNRLSLNPREQFFLTGMMFTGFKALPELIANYSIFFRGPIDDDGRLVAAPDWLHAPLGVKLPEDVRKELGLEFVLDPATGEKVWKYKAKWDYLLRQLPETSVLFNLTSSGKNRRGQDQLLKGISLSGVRPEPYDPLATQSDRLYEEKAAIDRRMDELNRRQINSDNPTREYTRLKNRLKKVDAQIERTQKRRKKQGDPVYVPGQDEEKGFFDSEKQGTSKKFFDDVKQEPSKKFFDGVR